MSTKFSKIDIGSIERKQKLNDKGFRLATRQVWSHEFHQEPKRSRPRQFNLQKTYSFAVPVILLVIILQGLIYLSGARRAKGEILGAATSAYSELHSASTNLSASDFSSATALFVSAQNNIRIAQQKLNSFGPLKWLAPQASSAGHLLNGASLLSQAGQKLSQALSLLDDLKVSGVGIATSDINQKISANRDALAQSRDLVLSATREFNAVDSIPLDYQETLKSAKQQVSDLDTILAKVIALEDLYLKFFNGQKTYLLIFQNYDEARATGGFIGTYGVLKTQNGSIKHLKIESIYNLDGQIFQQIAAPGPFQPAIKKWGIRDANWFADFPTSAQKLLYFFELGKETADGVLSMTPQMFEDLLKLTGPVEMPDYGVTLTADNFQETVQYKTSVDYDKQLNQPKKFLADFSGILLNRLSTFKQEQWFGVFQAAEKNLSEKQFLLYSKEPETQKQIEDLSFDGRVLSTDYDYLSLINTNLGGTKTDLSVSQSANLKSKVLSDGSIINTLTIIRNNKAGENNKDYLRVLVPLGSDFISATGFDEYNYHDSTSPGLATDPDLAAWDQGRMDSNVYSRIESGKTEFAGSINTPAGQERAATLVYILPFKIDSSQGYSLLVQKQSGSKSIQFEGSIDLAQYKVKWLAGKSSWDGENVKFKSDSNTDDFWPMVITK